jgi:hypothetical protein
MIKIIKPWAITLLLFGTLQLTAQNPQDKSKIKALKVAFFTERLSLSGSEAQIFWPIYNSFEEKRDNLRERQHREVYDLIDKAGNLTESQSKALLKKYLTIEEEEEEMDKEFYNKLANAISARKTLLLFKAEHDFRKQLIKHMRNRNEKKQ